MATPIRPLGRSGLAQNHTGVSTAMEGLDNDPTDLTLTSAIVVLTNIKTREPLQRNGAGSLILKWGLEQARKAGVPAYLEAAPDAKHLYETHGFRQIGEQVTDCSPYGMPGVTFTLARMRADP